MQGPSLHFTFDSSLNILILFNLFAYLSLAVFCTLFVLLSLVQVENKDAIPIKKSMSTAMISSIPEIFIQSYFLKKFIISQYFVRGTIYLLNKFRSSMIYLIKKD